MLLLQTVAPRGLIKGRRGEEGKSSGSAGAKQTHKVKTAHNPDRKVNPAEITSKHTRFVDYHVL